MAFSAIAAEVDTPQDYAHAEVNHRIANHLAIIASIVHSQARSLRADGAVDGSAVVNVLDEVAVRIDAVARLHHLLLSNPIDTSTVDLRAYLREIANAASSSLADAEQTRFFFDLDQECAIPTKQAAATGLFVIEAITNALKYSHPHGAPGIIRVSCRTSDANLFIEVADDGVGLPEGRDPNASNGIGMRLMRAIAHQLGGSLEFDPTHFGLCVRLMLPAATSSADI